MGQYTEVKQPKISKQSVWRNGPNRLPDEQPFLSIAPDSADER